MGAVQGDPEHADRVVFDLDPGEDVPSDVVKGAAKDVRDRLRRLSFKSFLRTSGGKGLHVVVPVHPSTTWGQCKAIAARIAREMAGDQPDQFVARSTKSIRKGKTFVDYLRKGRGATSVAPYSTRARAGAPVSMPIRWNSLAELQSASQFTLRTVPRWLGVVRTRGEEFTFSARLPSE